MKSTRKTAARGPTPLPVLAALPPAPAICKGCGECCRALTVDLTPEDHVPERYIVWEEGLRLMRQRKDLTCIALDRTRRTCRIYAQRPAVCRNFEHDGEPCRRVTQHLKKVARLR